MPFHWWWLARSGAAATHPRLRPLPGSPPPQILDGDKFLWQALGSGLWPVMVLVSEIVQTFVLADFW